jgi:hypothetical protein
VDFVWDFLTYALPFVDQGELSGHYLDLNMDMRDVCDGLRGSVAGVVPLDYIPVRCWWEGGEIIRYV